jgi:hypothetical protein
MTKFVKIESLSDSLDRRFFSDHELQADPSLVAEGWERRFTADTQRAAEAQELYSQLGYEVRLEPLHPGEFHDDCNDCHSSMASKFKTVYTRRKKS